MYDIFQITGDSSIMFQIEQKRKITQQMQKQKCYDIHWFLKLSVKSNPESEYITRYM